MDATQKSFSKYLTGLSTHELAVQLRAARANERFAHCQDVAVRSHELAEIIVAEINLRYSGKV